MKSDQSVRGTGLALLGVLFAGCGEAPESEVARPGSPQASEAPEEPQPPPFERVVVLLVDTLRPDHLGLGGYGRETAPFLGELAQRSTVFTRAHSTSCWTAPSVASLFTGLYPGEHGITVGFFVNRLRNRELAGLGRAAVELNRFREDTPTLPVLLADAGYRTFGLAANPNIGSEIGFDRGFDHFERLYRVDERLDPPAEEMEARLLAWEAELAAGRSFLYLHLNDPHAPLDARDPWYAGPDSVTPRLDVAAMPEGLEATPEEAAEEMARYDSELGYLDAAIARLYERLHWDEDTLLVVLSDHGEEFWEHGRRGHGTSLYGEQNRILLMLHAPGSVAEGHRVDVNVSLVDVLPTVLELLGRERPAEMSGVSLVPLLAPDAEAVDEGARAAFDERAVFAHWINPAPVPETVPEVPDTAHLWAVMQGPWRLVQDDDGVRLFDELRDPGNRTDRAAAEAEPVERLRRALAGFQEREARGMERRVEVELELDPRQVEALEKLGYGGGAEAQDG